MATSAGSHGLITLIGVRYTTGPVEAVEAIDLVCRRLELKTAPSRLETTPVHGGDFDDFGLLMEQLATAAGDLPPETIRALAHNHGTGQRRCCAVARNAAAPCRAAPCWQARSPIQWPTKWP